MAGADDTVGFFSGVWCRLRATASSWRRSGGGDNDDGGNDGDGEDEQATVRWRLARRAAAARRVARRLAFVSFNLEVLVFVYAFWRARRRNLSWRKLQPVQALTMLVIPALATIIYTAFLRFVRSLDLKDNTVLKRLEEEKQASDGEPREFSRNDINSAQKSDDVDDASNSLPATDSTAETSNPRKRRQSSISLRYDDGADLSWGHSKDFQPKPSGGLRQRTFSSRKTYTVNCSGTESSDENTQTTPSIVAVDSSRDMEFPALSDSAEVYGQFPLPSIRYIQLPSRDGSEEAPTVSTHLDQQGDTSVSIEDTVCSPFDYNHHSRPAIYGMLAETPTVHQELPAGGEHKMSDDDIVNTNLSSSNDNIIPSVGSHNSFCARDDSRLTEHGLSSLSAVFQELSVEVSEENSLTLPEKLEFSPVFMKEAPASPSDHFVIHSRLNDLSSNPTDTVLSVPETFEKLPLEGSKAESLLQPHRLEVLRTNSFTPVKIPNSCAIDHNGVIITSDQAGSTSPYICNNANINTTILNIDTVSPKLDLPAFPNLFGEGVEEKELSKFPVLGDNMMPFNSETEVLVPPLAVNNIEHSLVISELLYSQETEMMEVAGDVSFIKDKPELSSISSTESSMDGDDDGRVKEPCQLNAEEGNDIPVNMEEGNDTLAKMLVVRSELNYPGCPDLFAKGSRDSKKDEVSDLHLPVQNVVPFNLENEAFLDPLVVDTAQHSLATSELLLFTEGDDTTKVHGVVKEGLSELSDEGPCNHQKDVVNSSYDDSNTRNLMDSLVSVQFIADTNIRYLQGGQEALSEPLHQSSCNSEGIFLSSSEINNDVLYSSISSSSFLCANTVEGKAPFVGQDGLSECEEETGSAFLDTPILLDEATRAGSWTNYPGPSQCISDNKEIQSLCDGKEVPSEKLQRVTSGLDESLIYPELGRNSVKYSLYSRSSSCDSEVTMDTLRGVASFESENGHGSRSDERGRMMFPSVNSTENSANNANSAEFIPETNVMENLNFAGEAMGGSQYEVSPSLMDAFVAPDLWNGTGKSDNHLVFSSSVVPVVDAFDVLQTGRELSEVQYFQETKISPKLVNSTEHCLSSTIEDLQHVEKTSLVALQSAQEGLSESSFSLHETSMFPEEISDALPKTLKNHHFSGKASPELHENSKAKKDSENAKSSSCSPEVDLIESLVGAQEGTSQQQNKTNRGQEANSENYFNNTGRLDISNANILDTLQVEEVLASEMLDDVIFCTEGTLISVGDGNDAESSSNDPVCIPHNVHISTTSPLGFQEGSLKAEDESTMNSISRNKIDNAETTSLNPAYYVAEATVVAALQDTKKPLTELQDGNPLSCSGAYISLNEEKRTNPTDYSTSSSPMLEDNLIEIPESGIESTDGSCCSFEETLRSEMSSNSPRSASYNSLKDAVISSRIGLHEPLLIDFDNFDTIPADVERANNNKSLYENACTTSEHRDIAEGEADHADLFPNKSRLSSYALKDSCIEATESTNDGFFEPEHQKGPKMALSQVRMPSFVEETSEAENGHVDSRSVSSHDEISAAEAPLELSVDAGSKVLPEGSTTDVWLCTDKEPKGGRFKDNKEDVEELDEDHEVSPIPSDVSLNLYLLY